MRKIFNCLKNNSIDGKITYLNELLFQGMIKTVASHFIKKNRHHTMLKIINNKICVKDRIFNMLTMLISKIQT